MAEELESPDTSAPKSERRPTQQLPTDRIAFNRQLEILRAFAIQSGPSGKAASVSEVAKLVQMSATTIPLATPFFVACGLLQRQDKGFVPSADTLSFNRALEWSQENAAFKLAPTLIETWFAKAVVPKLKLRELSYEEALVALSEGSNASKKYSSQLGILLEYLQAAGLVVVDGSIVKPGQGNGVGNGVPVEKPTQVVSAEPAEAAATATRSSLSTTFMQPTEGAVQFHISVKVDMAELENWRPDRIAAFFGGLAQVLAAKSAVEKEAGQG